MIGLMKNLPVIGLWLATLAAMPASGGDETSLTLAVEEAAGVARTHWPVRGGVPFGRGKLRDAALVRLMNGNQEVPLQKKVLAVWPDGNVRWLLVDFLADVAAGQTARYTLEYGKHALAKPGVTVRQEAERIWIDTGALRFALDTKAFRGIETTFSRGGALRLVKDSGEEFRADRLPPDEVVVEDSGPIRASVKVAGWFAAAGGEKFCRYEARVFAWAGRQDVQCDLTWIFTGDSEQERIRERLRRDKRLRASSEVCAQHARAEFHEQLDCCLPQVARAAKDPNIATGEIERHGVHGWHYACACCSQATSFLSTSTRSASGNLRSDSSSMQRSLA
jgi:hypothetical protein